MVPFPQGLIKGQNKYAILSAILVQMKEEPTKFRAVKGMIVMTVKGKQISG